MGVIGLLSEIGSRWLRRTKWGLGALLAVLAVASPAYAQDLSAELSSAESSAASAEADISIVEARLEPVRERYAAISRSAGLANGVAVSARRHADDLETRLVEQRRDAASQVSRIEADYAREVDDHDDEVKGGIALGLAALLIGAIALGWGWFRATAAVAWLSDRPRGQAIGLCVFAGLALLIAGGVMAGGGGVIGVIGTTMVFLGFALPVVLLLARHSAQVQRSREKPVLKRERLPAWVKNAVAVVMLLVFVTGLGTAFLASDPEPPVVAAHLRQQAVDAKDDPADPPTSELVRARTKAESLEERALRVTAAQRAAHSGLEEMRQQLRRAKRQLASAQRKARYYTRRLAAVAAREAREAAVAAATAEAEAPITPSYSSCATAPSDIPVPPGSPLDGDGDGIGCES